MKSYFSLEKALGVQRAHRGFVLSLGQCYGLLTRPGYSAHSAHHGRPREQLFRRFVARPQASFC